MQQDEVIRYNAGQCNIGPVEIRRRYRIGYIGLGAMILFIIFAEYFSIPRLWKLLLFIPAFYSLSGFIQARKKFCYVYGYKGVFSLKGRKTFTRVTDHKSLREDRNTVLQIVSWVLVASVLVASLYYFLSE